MIGKKIKWAAILSAGESSRLQQITRFKAMAEIQGESLINRLIKKFLDLGIENIIVALNSKMQDQDFVCDPRLKMLNAKGVVKIFVSTPSSMHTLYEVFDYLKNKNKNKAEAENENSNYDGHILVSMVDTIVKDQHLKTFYDKTLLLKTDESMILTNRYIDDEKPLTVKLSSDGEFIKAFAVPVPKETNGQNNEQNDLVITSGLYCFSSNIYPLLHKSVNSGQEKLRNFLAQMLQNSCPIRNYTIDKTVDIDRPQDLDVANNFLKS